MQRLKEILVLLLLLLLVVPVDTFAQSAGGQISRRAKTAVKKETSKKKAVRSYSSASKKKSTQPPVSSANGSAVAPSSSSFRSFTETVNGVSFTMVAVKGGTFTMGATAEQGSEAYDDEKPAHQVTLTGFYIGETEVTQELWQAVMGSNPSYFKGAKLPVERVSYNDCKLFILRLNQLTGRTFRLPTEAEWEYAARGGSHSIGFKYSGSDNIDAVAWYDDNSGYKKGESHPDFGTHPVKQKQPNELGLYDMSGNVRERCQDWYGDYGSGSQTNPTGPSSGPYREYRGGSWYHDAGYCRVSSRNSNALTDSMYSLGLRLALSSLF